MHASASSYVAMRDFREGEDENVGDCAHSDASERVAALVIIVVGEGESEWVATSCDARYLYFVHLDQSLSQLSM